VQNFRYQGRLKFFDTNGKYGFIVIDGINTDLFVHYDDLSKAGISRDQLEQHNSNREKLPDFRELRFEFTYYEY
jgi:cold shock CspA family protein